MSSYQPDQSSLVLAERIAALAAEMVPLARTPEEASRLQDVARGRYPMLTVAMLRDVAGRDSRMSDRFTELFRPEPAESMCITAAFDEETVINGRANLAQTHYERFKCKSTWLAAFDELACQLGATMRAKKAMLAERSRVWQ